MASFTVINENPFPSNSSEPRFFVCLFVFVFVLFGFVLFCFVLCVGGGGL